LRQALAAKNFFTTSMACCIYISVLSEKVDKLSTFRRFLDLVKIAMANI